jgi:hypothetical protein
MLYRVLQIDRVLLFLEVRHGQPDPAHLSGWHPTCRRWPDTLAHRMVHGGAHPASLYPTPGLDASKPKETRAGNAHTTIPPMERKK